MRGIILSALILGATPTLGNERPWVAMSGPQIVRMLTGRTVEYPAGWQRFNASGRTLYHTGRDSWGYWAVRADQYCSMWPPSDLWACYDLEQRGKQVRFIGAAGDTTQGALRD